METKGGFFIVRQRIPPGPGRFQQRPGTDNVGFDKRRRAVNRAVNVAFSGQMHHRIGLIVAKYPVQFSAIADIHLFKSKTRIPGDRRQRHQIPRVGQLINHHHVIAGCSDDFTHHRRTDKTGAAGDQNRSHRHTPLVSTIKCWLTLSPLIALNSL